MMKSGKLKDITDIDELLKAQFKDLIEDMLKEELEHKLGYNKYDYTNKEIDNSRNEKRNKTVM